MNVVPAPVSVGMMQWWGQVSWCSIVIVLGAQVQAQVSPRAPQQCRLECMKVYTLHTTEEQVSQYWWSGVTILPYVAHQSPGLQWHCCQVNHSF